LASADPSLPGPAPSTERSARADASGITNAGAAPRVELEAHYFDPRRSVPVPARVFASDARLIVSGPGVDVECALGDVRIGPPLLGETLDAVLLPNGGKLETADGAAIDRLRELSGRPVPFGRIYRIEQSWPLAIAATLGVVLALVSACLWIIPLGALHVARTWPSLAQRIGHGTLALLDLRLEPTELAPPERERVQGIFARVASDHPQLGLKLALRKAGFANAFALPDGTVVLTDEIVHLSQHDDELLGVLFHEAGHIARGHGLRRVVESSMLALLATAYYGDADQVTALAAGLPLAYARSSYSREEELEADSAALGGLRRHAKDPRHFARILRALDSTTNERDRPIEYLSSHPATRERVQRFEAAATP